MVQAIRKSPNLQTQKTALPGGFDFLFMCAIISPDRYQLYNKTIKKQQTMSTTTTHREAILNIECYEYYKHLFFLTPPGYSFSHKETSFINNFTALLKDENHRLPPDLMSEILNGSHTVEILGLRGKCLAIQSLRTVLHKLETCDKVKTKNIFSELLQNPFCMKEIGLFNSVIRLSQKHLGIHSSDFTELLLLITDQKYELSNEALLSLWFGKNGFAEDPILKNTGNILFKTLQKIYSNSQKK